MVDFLRPSEDSLHHTEAVSDGRKLLPCAGIMPPTAAETVPETEDFVPGFDPKTKRLIVTNHTLVFLIQGCEKLIFCYGNYKIFYYISSPKN